MITSNHNPRLQQVRALLARRQEREESRLFVVEGVRLVEEALASGWRTAGIFYSAELSPRGQALVRQFAERGDETLEVEPRLMQSLTDTSTSQGLLGIFQIQSLPFSPPIHFVVIADAIRDPGNLGTLLRSAAAAGAQLVFLAPGTVDPFSPKVVRSAMGAHFRLPIESRSWDQINQFTVEHHLTPFLAESGGGTPCWQANLTAPLALVIGGEAEGPSPEARLFSVNPVTIPMPGKSESLNAAVAASILLFEIVRQRSS
ncbi:MAG TPA: RNA methyltransferase [Anaerolineaceae bacterium]